MPNANRRRAILAAQKVKYGPMRQPLPNNYKLPKLTAEERKAIYAPRHATDAPKHLQGAEWVRAWRTVEKATYGLTALCGLIFGGLVLGESKKSIKQ